MAANTISQLTTANTFQHWLTATQGLVGVANTLTNGAGETFYANTRLEVGGTGASLNVVTSATIEELYVNSLNVLTSFALSGNLSTISTTNTASIGSDLFVYGNTDIDGTLNATGNSTFANTEITNTLTFNVATGNTLTISGETTLDNVTFTGFLSGNGASLTDVTVSNTNIDGVIIEAQIADGAVTAGKLASGLSIPSPIGNGTYYLTSDNSETLWRAQTALSIATSQLSGTITNSQINDVANTKITGLITSAQIARVELSQGGTGGSDAATARTNLGLAIGTNVQAYDADLTVIGALAKTDSNFIVGNGSTWVAESGSTARTSLGIGTSNDVQLNSLGLGTAASATTGELRATNNITAYYSDKRLKTVSGNIQNAIEKIMTLNGVYYINNEVAAKYGYINKEQQVGVLAQEVQQILPEIVKPAPFDIGQNEDGTEYSLSGENYKTVQYEKLVPLLIEAIKELNQKIIKIENNNE